MSLVPIAQRAAHRMTPSTFFSVYPHTYAKLPYKEGDFAAVSLLAHTNFGLAVGPLVPESVNNLRDFLAWAKANPEKATYGSPAAGSVPHLIVAATAKLNNVELRHVPYRGSVPGLQDMRGGQIAAMSSPIGALTPHLVAGSGVPVDKTMRTKIGDQRPIELHLAADRFRHNFGQHGDKMGHLLRVRSAHERIVTGGGNGREGDHHAHHRAQQAQEGAAGNGNGQQHDLAVQGLALADQVSIDGGATLRSASLIGSEASRVLHRASIPVLTFRALVSADHPEKPQTLS